MAAKVALLRIALENHFDVGLLERLQPQRSWDCDLDVHLSSLSHRSNGNAFVECRLQATGLRYSEL
jgi:hypothetical protein